MLGASATAMCTQTHWPHLGYPERLGFSRWRRSYGVVSPRIRMEVRFSSHMGNWMASPQSASGRRLGWRMTQTGSRRRRLGDSATPLCCGILCVVWRWSISRPLRNLTYFAPMNSPPRSERTRLMRAPCCVSAQASTSSPTDGHENAKHLNSVPSCKEM